jgi:hypothetical protein
MAKREKEKYLEKKAKILAWPSRREVERLKAGEGAPTGKNRKVLLGKPMHIL